MSKEKQIGEMAKILTEYEDCGDCNNCPYHECCGEERIATELYNAGYRKQSDVAKQIFEDMQSCLIQRHWNGLDIVSFEFNAVKYAELKKKYTEETE